MRTPTRVDDPDVEDGIYYPSSDGKPMAETQFHLLTIRWLLDSLDDYFANREDVYVIGDMLWYWERGNPRACRSPDAMVVFGVGKNRRRSFRSWNEGDAIPRVCFEIASRRTWRANLNEIYQDYEAVGVREYFIFDPTREYLEAPLLGFRLQRGEYQPIRRQSDGGMRSRELGLTLRPEDLMLRLVDTKTGQLVLTRQERADEQQRLAAEERQRADEQQRLVAEERQRADEQQRLVAEERQRADEERQRANEQKRRADEQERRAAEERLRADQMKDEVERLRAMLNNQQPKTNGTH